MSSIDLRKIRNAFDGAVVKTRLSTAEVRDYLKNAKDPGYWRKLNPELRVSDKLSFARIPAAPISRSVRRAALEKLKEDGYFQIDSVYSRELMERMRRGIENLRKANWPPMFAFIYDEYWLVKRLPSLVGFIDEALGPGHGELRNSWCHYINPIPGAHGWTPHMDGPYLSGRISVWVPVTDATLDNGCIYIVPEGRLPDRLIDTFNGKRTLSSHEVRMIMQAARALPVKAGGIIGWNFRVLHWGSMAGVTEQPRVSITTEFISEEALSRKEDCLPLDSHSSIPTFEVRLQIIGRAIQNFHQFEPRMLRYVELARHLW